MAHHSRLSTPKAGKCFTSCCSLFVEIALILVGLSWEVNYCHALNKGMVIAIRTVYGLVMPDPDELPRDLGSLFLRLRLFLWY